MPQLKKASRSGLHDWQLKKSLLKALYGVPYDKALITAAADGNVPDSRMSDFIDKCYDTFRRWQDGSRPTAPKSIQFWECIIHDYELDVTVRRAMSCPIENFIALFPQDKKLITAVGELTAENDKVLDSDAKAELLRQYGSTTGVTWAAAADEYIVHANTRTNVEGPLTGMQAGRIQVHQFYCWPETAKAWSALVDSDNYRMYIDCWLSLRALVESAHWKAAVSNGRYNAAVALGGGGSPDKDRVLANSLRSSSKQEGAQLSYVINDISDDMIRVSAKRFHRGEDELAQGVEITYLQRDFLLLDDEEYKRPSNWDSVIWAILGGTIGNVYERDFFRSISAPSRVGDLLIVGVDTIGDDTADAFEERMRTQYRCKELDELLLTPLDAPAGQRGAEDPLVEVSVIAGPGHNPYSNVPNSWTAVFSTPPLSGRDHIVLATSTRYVLDDFFGYARRFGWEHLGTTPAPSDSTFRQVLLRRVE